VVLIVPIWNFTKFQCYLANDTFKVILVSAAAEAALFLGIFSRLYDQQFLNRVNKPKPLDNALFFILHRFKIKYAKI